MIHLETDRCYCIIGEENNIYQELRSGPFLDHWREEVIATFDTSQHYDR